MVAMRHDLYGLSATGRSSAEVCQSLRITVLCFGTFQDGEPEANTHCIMLAVRRKATSGKQATSTESTVTLARMDEEAFGIPRSFIDNVQDGYYAVRLHEGGEYTFVRVSRPRYGKYAGSVKFQTQHGDQLKLACVLRPDGMFEVRNGDIKTAVIEIASNPVQTAFQYGKQMGSCCKCGKPLTRQPWIDYGIGIDCDQRYPEIRHHAEELREIEQGVT